MLHFEYLPHQLTSSQEQLFKPLNTTFLTWIQTLDQLTNLIEKLNKEKEIAIDLEVNRYRLFISSFIFFSKIRIMITDLFKDLFV